MADSNPEVNTLCDGDPLARALAGLRPAPAGLDPTRVVFLAGRDAGTRGVAFWRRAFLAQAALIVGLGGLTVLHFNQVSDLEGQVAELRNRQPAPYAAPMPLQMPGPQGEPESAPMPREAPAEPYAPGRAGFVATAAEPTPEERAKWLQLRNHVLAAGVGGLPTPARPQPPTGDWGGSELPRVYAHPLTPKPMPKPDLPPD